MPFQGDLNQSYRGAVMPITSLSFASAQSVRRCVATVGRPAGAVIASAVLLVGGGGPAASSEPAAVPSAAGSTSAPVRDTAAACSARIRVNSNIPPGADPGEPAPAPQEMKDWAASVSPDFEVLAANLPAELAPHVETQRADLRKAQQGERIDVDNPATIESASAIDAFVFDKCHFPQLDVTSTDGTYGPIPATLKPGPTSIRFAATGAESRAACVLLIARVRDGQRVSLQDLTAEKVKIEDVADIVTAVLPAATGQPGYGTADLKSGRYVLETPLGALPECSGGVTEAEVMVP